MRKIMKILSSRIFVCIILIALQIWLLISWLYNTAVAHAALPSTGILAIIMSIYVINRPEDSAYKIGWCFLMLAVPVFGCTMYLLCVENKMPQRLANGTIHANDRMKGLLSQDEEVRKDLDEKIPGKKRLFTYGLEKSGFPVYEHTQAQYFGCGEEWFPVFLEELKKARKFIFLEYFIIDKGSMWDETLAVLKQKVKEGVEVKVIYDDFGCVALPSRYDRTLNEMGIETYKFNRLRPALMITMNNRDHRKLAIIDNQVGFTGGLNLADEYVNRITRFGYWRDSAIMVKGEAVWSMTVMFLGMYSYLRKDDDNIDYSRYHLPLEQAYEEAGFFQPFSDTPTDDADMGLSAHLNLINTARKYVYIDTPYLILNDAMKTALILAASNGVDVRILTPHVPDKQIAFQMARGNYEELLKGGVKIYEYTPGFNHTKNIVADDDAGIVGSINTDYRSYYLHFEDGILFHDEKTAVSMREAFEKGLAQSQEISLEDCRKAPLILRLIRGMMNLFAPLF